MALTKGTFLLGFSLSGNLNVGEYCSGGALTGGGEEGIEIKSQRSNATKEQWNEITSLFAISVTTWPFHWIPLPLSDKTRLKRTFRIIFENIPSNPFISPTKSKRAATTI